MKNLVHIPTLNLVTWFDNIVDNKTDEDAKKLLLGLRTVVNERFAYYVERFDEGQLITITDSIFQKNHPELLSCYKSEGNTLVSLKKIIRDLQHDDLKGTCQYCCVGKPKSIDHYLPIGDYPEYSVLGINLIPCCKDCNEKKKSYWKENGIRGIINFYLDEIPNQQFLYGQIEFTGNVPCIKYRIENIGNVIEQPLFAVIQKHYQRLELINLYNLESNDELDEMIRSFSVYIINPTIDSLRNSLLLDAAQLRNQFGTNYWRAVMRVSLANSDNFLQYLIDKINNPQV